MTINFTADSTNEDGWMSRLVTPVFSKLPSCINLHFGTNSGRNALPAFTFSFWPGSFVSLVVFSLLLITSPTAKLLLARLKPSP